MVTVKPSGITRIFAELVRASRLRGRIRRFYLKHGIELVVLVKDGTITLTIKRPKVRVGTRELETFRRDCGVPDNHETLTPPDQATREVAGVAWYFVTWRWRDEHQP